VDSPPLRAPALSPLHDLGRSGPRASSYVSIYLRPSVGISGRRRPTVDEVTAREYERIWPASRGPSMRKELVIRPALNDESGARATARCALCRRPACQARINRRTTWSAVPVARMANLSLEPWQIVKLMLAYVWVGSMIAGRASGDYQACIKFGQLGLSFGLEKRWLTRFQAGRI